MFIKPINEQKNKNVDCHLFDSSFFFGVERRHFNDLVKILKTDVLKWKSFYEALDIDHVEMFSTTQKLLRGDIHAAEAYRDALDTWKEINGRKATFGSLNLVLRNLLKWEDAAGKYHVTQ